MVFIDVDVIGSEFGSQVHHIRILDDFRNAVGP